MFYNEYGISPIRWQATDRAKRAVPHKIAKLFGIWRSVGGVRVKTEKHDRRSKRTQRLLGAALITLMQTRPYAELTVEEILRQADVGRSTFYAQYFDKDDLLASEIERMLAALVQDIEQTAPTSVNTGALLPSLGLFRHVEAHLPLFQSLVRGGGFDVALRALRQRLCAYAEERLSAEGILAPIARTVAAQSVVGSLLALLQWWLETELVISAERLDDWYRQLVAPGVRATIGQ